MLPITSVAQVSPMQVRKLRWLVPIMLIAILVAVAPSLNPYHLRALTMGLLFGYLAASWNIVGGYAGQMSLGHAMFFGLGSYSVAVLAKTDAPLLLALPVALALAGLLAWVVAAICFRYSLRGIYFAVGSLLLAEIARIVVVNSDALGRSQGLEIPLRPGVLNLGFESNLPFFYLYLAMVLAMVVGCRLLERSRFGYSMIALREQEEAAKALAIDANQVKRRAFVISAMLTTVGGVAYACMVRFVEPAYDLSLAITLVMVMGAVLGGRGTVLGPLVGGLVVVLVQEILTTIGSAVGTTSVSALAQLIYGLFFVVILLAFPRGIVGEILSRRANRRAVAGAAIVESTQ
ncbi:branched-chain amino acid ABC transporter permease [Cupriavidus sp. CuC1]|uniref:branched-chain amino acid ABC transporter permease n=1 Tax=Cupriavidus sp. CuC1 TaxID=3373131 RepID=UPI0037CF223A